MKSSTLEDDLNKVIEKHIAQRGKTDDPLASQEICLALSNLAAVAFGTSSLTSVGLDSVVRSFGETVLWRAKKLRSKVESRRTN